MSRVAKNPISIPKNVDINVAGYSLTLKGPKGVLEAKIPTSIKVKIADGMISIAGIADNHLSDSLAGTTRANIANMVIGVSVGYERKLTMVGVGYRAQSKGNILSLSLGYSHPIEFPVPEGLTIDTPSQTEILVKGCDRQKVGQAAADIRAFRPPEPYKGKGVRYSDEEIIRKESKKK